jgi:uncharacterized pyridoxal phosphate-containing UPF0001 family protein
MLTGPQNLPENLRNVRNRIAAAASAAGREPASITLIGVGKSQPASAIRAAVEAGLADLGENYVQEAVDKIGLLANASVTWHFIGALQSNKTREVAENFQWVHTGGLKELADSVAGLPGLRLRGLMCIPPPESDPGRQRHWFAELRRLRDGLNDAGHALDVLSMGMSDDFELAITEGATHVRVGTAIFGPRS